TVEDNRQLYDVINHEVGHQWFPMMVGSNEPAFAWQDEGLTTYIEGLATADRFPDAIPFAQERQYYAFVATTEMEIEMMRPADLFGPDQAPRVIAAYSKPALMLHALGAVIGEETVHEALREYARRWLLR